MLSILLLLLVITLGTIAIATDYCAKCSNHVACNNDGNFKDDCPEDAYIVPMTSDIVETLLKAHNKLRNTIAGGNETGFSEASKMMIVGWNPELAYLAELNVRKCHMKHDKCHSTDAYPTSGQNLFSLITTKYKSVKKDLKKAVISWYNEVKDAIQDDINLCCDEEKNKKIGHFTELVRDEVEAIGCAASRFTTSDGWKHTLVACNYSHGNYRGIPIYVSGDSGSQCLNGTDIFFENLCSN